MSWTKSVEQEGYYWWKRDSKAPPDIVNLIDYNDGTGLHILSFGYDLDRREALAEWLKWSPESQFWGPLNAPEA